MINLPQQVLDLINQSCKTLRAVENYYLQKAMREAAQPQYVDQPTHHYNPPSY